MILQHVPYLAQKRIVLASGSPRRRELLSSLGLKFEVIVSTFDEKLPKDQYPTAAQYAVETARHKALDVAQMCAAQQPANVDLIISADTVVDCSGQILEKPDDAAHALQMLTSLSGGSHQVHTGVVLVLPNASDPKTGSKPLVHAFSETTQVQFDDLSQEVLQAYVQSGEPFGKAGAYGIQGLASTFVRGISGCYFNVVGFPIHRFSAELAKLIKDQHLLLQ